MDHTIIAAGIARRSYDHRVAHSTHRFAPAVGGGRVDPQAK